MDFEFVFFSTLVPLVAGFVSFTMLQRVTSDRGVLNPDTRKDNMGFSSRNWITKKALYKMIYHLETGLLRRPYTR